MKRNELKTDMNYRPLSFMVKEMKQVTINTAEI